MVVILEKVTRSHCWSEVQYNIWKAGQVASWYKTTLTAETK